MIANDTPWQKRTDEWVEMQHRSNKRKVQKQEAEDKRNKKKRRAQPA